MSLIASIGMLLTAVSSLLGNPNIGSDPAVLQQAQTILVQASNLAAQVAALPTSTDVAVVTSTVAVPSVTATSTVPAPVDTGAGAGTQTVAAPSAPAVSQPTIMQTKTISVSFNATGTDAFVTITNDTGVAVRVKNIAVTGGTVAGISIGKTYGGYIYSPSFADASGKKFDRFTCNGIGSLGIAKGYGENSDPCLRKDNSGFVVNELKAGETMVLRYIGTPTGVTYQPGSIVEVESGNDVTF